MGKLRLKFTQLVRFRARNWAHACTCTKRSSLSSLWGCSSSGSAINRIHLKPEGLASGIFQLVKNVKFWRKRYRGRLCSVLSWILCHLEPLLEHGPLMHMKGLTPAIFQGMYDNFLQLYRVHPCVVCVGVHNLLEMVPFEKYKCVLFYKHR